MIPSAEADPTKMVSYGERMAESLIEVNDAVFGYGGRAVVRVAHLELARGQCLGIFGPNGSGKTTLVRGITGLLSPMAGQVAHEPIGPSSKLRIGYLPQHRNIELHWPMTALDAASLAISARRLFGWIGPRVKDVLAMMNRLKILSISSLRCPRFSLFALALSSRKSTNASRDVS